MDEIELKIKPYGCCANPDFNLIHAQSVVIVFQNKNVLKSSMHSVRSVNKLTDLNQDPPQMRIKCTLRLCSIIR